MLFRWDAAQPPRKGLILNTTPFNVTSSRSLVGVPQSNRLCIRCLNKSSISVTSSLLQIMTTNVLVLAFEWLDLWRGLRIGAYLSSLLEHSNRRVNLMLLLVFLSDPSHWMAQKGPVPAGYRLLASAMGHSPQLAIFKRFGTLNAQNILYLQAELTVLENKLEEYIKEDQSARGGDRDIYDRDWETLKTSHEINSPGNDDKPPPTTVSNRQWKTFLEIRGKLKEYSINRYVSSSSTRRLTCCRWSTLTTKWIAQGRVLSFRLSQEGMRRPPLPRQSYLVRCISGFQEMAQGRSADSKIHYSLKAQPLKIFWCYNNGCHPQREGMSHLSDQTVRFGMKRIQTTSLWGCLKQKILCIDHCPTVLFKSITSWLGVISKSAWTSFYFVLGRWFPTETRYE